MTHTVFYIFATIMLAFGMLVVINRNPVSSAMSLVVCFIGLAALFITLDAYFIGIIQILVYAGAVMVLFLFIIMLLDIRAEKRRRINYVAFGGGILLTIALGIQIVSVISNFAPAEEEIQPIDHMKVGIRITAPIEIVKMAMMHAVSAPKVTRGMEPS